MKHIVAAVFRFSADNFTMEWPTVVHQDDASKCGVYCIAYVLALCQKRQVCEIRLNHNVGPPSKYSCFTPSILFCFIFMAARQFLVKCLENADFSEFFPTLEKSAPLVMPDRMETIQIHCCCRMPNTSAIERMIICSCRSPQCPKRFHHSCVARSADFDRRTWNCGFRRTL